MKILITGASGAIGHYITEQLILHSDHELFLLVRNPNKLKLNYHHRPNITILSGNLLNIAQYANLIKTIDQAILAATSWGGKTEIFEINVNKTIELLQLLDPQICQQVIYFSTASILDQNQQILPQAQEIGTDYIRSKHLCYTQLPTLKIHQKITTVFPTLVLAGDPNKPYSHLSGGLNNVIKWFPLIKFFKVDASFHYIHAQDIAQIIHHLINHPQPPQQLVLGNPVVTVNQLIREFSNTLKQKIYFQIPLPIWLANIFIILFRVQMSPWDRFCLNYRHFLYKNAINPTSLGLTTYCQTSRDILKTSKVIPD